MLANQSVWQPLCFIGSSDTDQSVAWSAQPGNYVVRVVDDRGRADARDLTVQATS